jgi:hypothetical protein
MTSIQNPALPLLFKAAFADAHFKVVQQIWQRCDHHCTLPYDQRDEVLYPPHKLGTIDQHRFDRNHPYYEACDEARELCVELGRFCQKNNVDLSYSSMLNSLYFKSNYWEAFEAGRVVTCDVLTPKAIHDSVEKRNVLHWNGWTITAGKVIECDDDYGDPTFIAPLVAKHNTGHPHIVFELPGQSSKRAREAYKLITGATFIGDDGLKDDPLHSYEMYAYAF